tara:strand:+ start:210 stop:404 length:195 start_codon:yes stop_codon:yes gene_type:complete
VNASELRDLADGELLEKERELTRELWKTKIDNFTNQLDDSAKIRRLRRAIARVKTIMTERAKQS